MSYSRWTSKESWYCFWHVSDAKTANNEILSIWYTKDPATPNYTYKQLKKDREWVWWDIKSRCSPKGRETFDYCVDAFLERVEAEYKLTDLVATDSPSQTEADKSVEAAAHPEDTCNRCGRHNPVWFAPNELWNKVMPDKAAIVCPVCFTVLAEAKGIKPTAWCLSEESKR